MEKSNVLLLRHETRDSLYSLSMRKDKEFKRLENESIDGSCDIVLMSQRCCLSCILMHSVFLMLRG